MSPPNIGKIAEGAWGVTRAVVGRWVTKDHQSIPIVLDSDAAWTAKAPLDINLSTSWALHPIFAVLG